MKDYILHLAIACSPNVAPETIDQIIRVESAYQEFAIHVNERKTSTGEAVRYNVASQPSDLLTALALAQDALSLGHTIDIGLMQINSSNLNSLDLTLVEAFDPCKNISGGGKILTEFYRRAADKMGEGQQALLSALSSYNTGDPIRGFTNGYLSKYLTVGENDEVVEQALRASTTVAIPEHMIKEETMMNNDSDVVFEVNEADAKKGAVEKLYKDAEDQTVSVRQDVADEMGFFLETAITVEDIEDSISEPEQQNDQ